MKTVRNCLRSEREDVNLVMIATLLNFSGEEAIKDFNTLQFARGHKKKLDKALEEFEWYSS